MKYGKNGEHATAIEFLYLQQLEAFHPLNSEKPTMEKNQKVIVSFVLRTEK